MISEQTSLVRKAGIRSLAVTAIAALWFPYSGWAATAKWDHAANIKDAASRLALLHRREGSLGVVKFLDACYRTHMLASDFSQGLEACMAQDYMHSQMMASIYSKMPPEQRQKAGIPAPEMIAQAMGKRFVAAFAQYKVPVAEAEEFKKLVDQHGFPVFLKSVVPKGTASEDEAKGKDNKNEKN